MEIDEIVVFRKWSEDEKNPFLLEAKITDFRSIVCVRSKSGLQFEGRGDYLHSVSERASAEGAVVECLEKIEEVITELKLLKERILLSSFEILESTAKYRN